MEWELQGDRPIWLQLTEQIQLRIVSGEYPAGERLPSVRDLAAEAAVNPNTMQKALTELERGGLVYSQRTSGRFITQDQQLIQQLKQRLAREETDLSGCILAADIREAAEKCRELPGNILLATGAKELPAFCQALGEPGRVFPRVLPLAESLEQCRAAGIPAGSVIAIQGPFSRELNLALMEQFSISVLVTKDGGKAGGMPEKLAAARERGARVVAIRRPTLPGAVCSMAEILARLTGEEEKG